VVISPKKLPPVRKGTGSSREVFRLKVIFNDGGITIDAEANQTMIYVMGIVCSKWLNILRNGDGSIDAHPWKVRGPSLTEFVYIHRDACEDRRTKKWREAHEMCEKSKKSIPAYEKLNCSQLYTASIILRSSKFNWYRSTFPSLVIDSRSSSLLLQTSSPYHFTSIILRNATILSRFL
jgi:hypothetical protein